VRLVFIHGPAASGKLSSAAILHELEAKGAFDYPPIPSAATIDTGGAAPADAALRIQGALGLGGA